MNFCNQNLKITKIKKRNKPFKIIILYNYYKEKFNSYKIKQPKIIKSLIREQMNFKDTTKFN